MEWCSKINSRIIFIKEGKKKEILRNIYSTHVHCCRSQWPSKKKGKRKKKWFAIYCQGHSSGERPIKTNDPLESPTLAKSRKKEGRWKSKARTRYTRDARNAPCSNRFSTVARSSLTNQTLTSADASRQSNLSRKTLRRGQDDEWSELPRAFLFLEKLPNFVFYCTNLLSIFDQSRINVYTYLIFD